MRVVIGEDDALMREGLSLVLERDGFDVVATAADAEGLTRAAAASRPDLVVADIRMPPQHGDDGLRATLNIRKRTPAVAILVLSRHVQPLCVQRLLDGGAEGTGYLLKQRIASVASFCADARRVAAGGTVLDPEVITALLTGVQLGDPLALLTARQRDVLALMAEGRSNTAIAARLHLTEKAVTRHVSHVYDNLGLEPGPDNHRRVLAVLRYLTR